MSDPATSLRLWRQRPVRVALGCFIWLALVIWLASLLHDRQGREIQAAQKMGTWLLERGSRVKVSLPEAVEIAVGDPVFYAARPGQLTLIGEVEDLLADDKWLRKRLALVGEVQLRIHLSGQDGLNAGSPVTYISIPRTASWVFKTLLPREKLLWIASEWNQTLLDHREEVFAAIAPVARLLLSDVERLVFEDLPAAIERRREALGTIFRRFQERSFNRDFLPLLENELFPVVVRHMQPALDEIGKEVLEKLPVWSLTWRLLYEKIPYTAEDYVRREWRRFVEAEVVPIIRDHLPDILGAIQDVATEASTNPRVAASVRHSLSDLLSDADLQHQARLIFQEIILDNPRFHQAMWARLEAPETEEAFNRLAVFLGPLFRRVGDAILGTRGGGITPEFARVLRTQILEKDRRWILFEPGEGAVLKGDERLRALIDRDGDGDGDGDRDGLEGESPDEPWRARLPTSRSGGISRQAKPDIRDVSEAETETETETDDREGEAPSEPSKKKTPVGTEPDTEPEPGNDD